jgi:type IV secretion system protein TrbL
MQGTASKMVLAGMTLALLALTFTMSAHAADPGAVANNANYTNLIDLFNTESAKWQAPLQSAAQVLYGTLITITLVLTFIPLAVRGAEINEWAETLVKFVLVTGFWLWMIHNFSSLASGIINGFRHLAKNATAASGAGQTLSPTDILKTGLDLVHFSMSQASVWNLPLAIAMVAASVIIIVVFALVAGLVAVTLAESYIVINASVIFMAFAGLRFTSDIAMHAIKYAIGVGVKLFALQLIVGVSMAVFQSWVLQYGNPGLIATIEDGFGLAALAILVFFLAVYIPPALMGMVTGAHGGGLQFSGAAAGAAAIAGGAGFAAASVAGGASALQGAGSLASAQLAHATAAGTAPSSSIGRMVTWTGNAAANFGGAALQDLGARLGGRPGAHSGTMGGRMGDGMRARGDTLLAAMTAPRPPVIERVAPSTPPAGASSTDGPAPPAPAPAAPAASPSLNASSNATENGGSIRGEK